ncbi:MAG: polysaccharide deacetylase family protein [Flavobacteriales bacterium]
MSEALGHLLRRKAVENRLLGIGGTGKARVLMYHGIGEPGCHMVNIRHIGVDVFEKHLQLYREHFNVVPLEALFKGDRHPDKLTIALTFDDGLRNNLTNALPLLEKYSTPASFFITGANPLGLRILWGDLLDLSAHIGERKRVTADGQEWKLLNRHYRTGEKKLRDRIKELGAWAPKQQLYDQLADQLDGPLQPLRMFWELMNDAEIMQLARHPLVSIGSHGWWHNNMGNIPLADAMDEVRSSKTYLEQLTGKAVAGIAWPDGSYSVQLTKAAQAMGVTHQLAVSYLQPDDADNPGLLDRFGVYDFPVHPRFLLHNMARDAA